MSWSAVRRVISWIIPEVVLLAATAVSLRLGTLRQPVAQFAEFYPYVVFGLGLLLALRFQRSRLVFALLLLALAEWGLDQAPRGPGGRFAFQATAALLPLNLAAITLMTERGTFTRHGLLRLAALAAQVVGVLAAAQLAPVRAIAVATYRVLPAQWFEWTPLAQIPLLAALAAAALIAVAMFFQTSPAARAFFWALVAVCFALQVRLAGVAGTLYLSTAGLILVVAVIETSYLMAYQDGLTGLPARRALNEALQRVAGHYTIAMVDVDHFKKLNDNYGHDVGDQVLRMVGARLAKVSGGGRAFRYGGEEFALLFPGKSLEQCLPELETLRQEIEESRFTVRRRLRPRRKPTRTRNGNPTRRHITLTVSIGAAEPDGRQKTAEQVIAAADRALYRAKEAGRNRVRT